MAEINWGLLQTPDIGTNALAAFEQGRAQRKQEMAQNALAAYATNPNEQTLTGIAPYNPQFVIERKQAMQTEQRKAMLEGAKIIGEAALYADTPEKWDAAVTHLSQYYPQLAQYKGQFSPELRNAAIAGAGEIKTKFEMEKPVTVGPGSHLVDPATGKPKFSAPFAPRPVTLNPEQTLVGYDPNAQGGDPAGVWQRMLQTESGGNHFRKDGSVITSPAGAIGIAQVMPGTAPEAARLAGVAFDEQRYRNDPAYNEALGKAYFQKQLETFGGDMEKAVAAYNAGPGNVQKAVARGGENWKQFLPQETKGYLQSVLGGGATVLAKGAPKPPKPQWQQMTPQEVEAAGLPPGVYQRSPDGEIKPIGGQGGNAGKGSPQEQAKGAQMALQAAGVTGNSDPVSILIKKSTSGRFQAGAARLWSDVTGDSTDGMEAIARLKTIGNDMVLQAAGGSLGAQISNTDRDFMAARFGDIGNPELTVDERLAAWDQVKTRLKTLAASAQPAAKPAAKAPAKVIRYDAKGNRIP